jgi:peroxiredoxin
MNLVMTTTEQRPDWRQRLRNSRFGTLLVLSLTAALVMGAAYLISRPKAGDPGVTEVALTGPSNGAAPKVGSPAQDFKTTTVDGKEVSLSAYKGSPVWLTFGASWCAPCQAESPDIQAAYAKHKASGVVVLAVFISEDAATVRDYGDRVGLTYPKVVDPDTRIASAYRVNGIPVHYFIDRAGILRSIKTGSLNPEAMDTQIEAISR